MPVLSTIAAIAIPAITGGIGAVENIKNAGAQRKALTIQEQIAQQEMADKQQAFKQLIDFFSPYLQQGSPFLSMIQRAAAETNATGANNAAGQIRQTIGQTGLGYGPSGATAAALGGLGAETAKTGSQNYLQNLLTNEQVKFQAAQGINAAGSMAGSTQNQPNVSVNMPATSAGSGFAALGDILKGILTKTNNSNVFSPSNPGGTLPPFNPGSIPTVPIGVPPVTQGWVT